MVELNGCNVGPKPGSRSKQVTHIKIHHRLDHLRDIEDGIAHIRKLAAELEEPRFDTEYEAGYYDTSDSEHLTVSGWRPMTPKELDDYAMAVKQENAQRDRRDQSQLERLRRVHPEWLKDGLQ